MKATVIGCGAWGTALATILAENHNETVIWCHDEKIAKDINEKHENTVLFPDIRLRENIVALTDLEKAVHNADMVLLVTASGFFKGIVERVIPLLKPEMLLVSATKGLNPVDKKRTSQMLFDLLPEDRKNNFVILSGPNIAREIAHKKPAVTVMASHDQAAARRAQEFFSTSYFRAYTNDDITGTELGGTLKNIIAIAAGIVDGMGLGDNTKSALMVRGMVEIIRFGTHFGAKQETFYGLAGMGDLITTCSSVLSRNHIVGEKLAQGLKLEEILGSMTAVAEGVETARFVHNIAKEEGIDMPVTEQIYKVLFKNKPVTDAIQDLMTRELTSEIE